MKKIVSYQHQKANQDKMYNHWQIVSINKNARVKSHFENINRYV